MAYFLLSSKELAQNPVRVNSMRRETVADWLGGARRTLCACKEPYRSDRKPARSSSEKSFGCSQTAKWPPLGSKSKQNQ
jgi:hypothetical protein